jgi:SAM-dependent methyltransferase
VTDSYTYVGSELELFAAARNWKSYVRRQIAPYLAGDVLEVGAGLGGTTKAYCPAGPARWVCLEPDAVLAQRLADSICSGELPARCSVEVGTLVDHPADDLFDAILYIDVLEHIEDDYAEMARAARHLRPGGVVVALSPAHQSLFSPFDRSVGHYRRYSLSTLKALAPPGLVPVRFVYLDSFGLLASLGNRLILKSGMPNARQIAFWDNVLVRLSRVVDPLLAYRLGKSVLGILRRPNTN